MTILERTAAANKLLLRSPAVTLNMIILLAVYFDDTKRRQSHRAVSTISEPTIAATISRSDTATLSRLGSQPNRRNSRPPTTAPARPSPKLRHRPKPPRSQVTSAPASPPPTSPMTIQTMTSSSDGMKDVIVRPGAETKISIRLAQSGLLNQACLIRLGRTALMPFEAPSCRSQPLRLFVEHLDFLFELRDP